MYVQKSICYMVNSYSWQHLSKLAAFYLLATEFQRTYNESRWVERFKMSGKSYKDWAMEQPQSHIHMKEEPIRNSKGVAHYLEVNSELLTHINVF